MVDENRLAAMRTSESRIRENLSKFGKSVETEFHGHAIMNARKGWQPLEGKFHLKISVIRSFITEIESIQGQFIVEAIDLSKFERLSHSRISPHSYTSERLLLRINDLAIARATETKIFSDKISKEERARLRYLNILEFNRLQQITSMNYIDSKREFGIQIADMCAYIVRRYLDRVDQNPRTARLISEIKAQIDKSTIPKKRSEWWSL